MKQKIFLIGYLGRTVDDLRKIVGKGTLLDIRISPQSRKPGFSKKRLSETFGDRYEWVYELGNESSEEGTIQLYDPDIGIEIVKEVYKVTKHHVYLMCACRDGETCHRATVGALLRQLNYSVEEYGG